MTCITHPRAGGEGGGGVMEGTFQEWWWKDDMVNKVVGHVNACMGEVDGNTVLKLTATRNNGGRWMSDYGIASVAMECTYSIN